MKQSVSTGVNYWPAAGLCTGGRILTSRVEQDFRRLAAAGFQVVRIFLIWEDFQPVPDKFPGSPDCLVAVADVAACCGIKFSPPFSAAI